MGIGQAFKNASKIGLAGIAGYGVGVVNDEVAELVDYVMPDTERSTPSFFAILNAVAVVVLAAILAVALLPALQETMKND